MTNQLLPEYRPGFCGDSCLHLVVRVSSMQAADFLSEQIHACGGLCQFNETGESLVLNILALPRTRVDWFLQKLQMLFEKAEAKWGNAAVDVLDMRLVSSPFKDKDVPNDGEGKGEKISRLGILLEPGHVFGTGYHPSTNLAIKMIDRLSEEQADFPPRVLDFGCGSGILGLYCARKGAASVHGIDISPEALVQAAKNIALNCLESVVKVSASSLTDFRGGFDLIVANLTPSVLIRVIPEIVPKIKAGGWLVLSGFRQRLAEDAKATGKKLGLDIRGECDEEGWKALLLKK